MGNRNLEESAMGAADALLSAAAFLSASSKSTLSWHGLGLCAQELKWLGLLHELTRGTPVPRTFTLRELVPHCESKACTHLKQESSRYDSILARARVFQSLSPKMETLKDAMRPNAHREREQVKATITGMIARLNQKLVAAGKSPVLAPAKTAEDWESAQKYARRVTVPTKVPLDPTELQKINDLCVAEAKALDKFEKIVSEMQILDEEGPAPDVFRHFTAEEQAAMLEAMRKRLHGYEPMHPKYRL